MKKIIGVLILFWAGGWLVSCGGDGAVATQNIEEARIGSVGNCESVKGSAVSISVVDDANNMTINGAEIRYRVNDGDWKTIEEADTNPTPISGPPGKYDLEVRKEGYTFQTAVVFVPQDESCSIMQQDVKISLRQPTICPQPPQVIILDVVKPTILDGLSINVHIPPGMPTSRNCEQGKCTVNLQTGNIGDYEVEFVGFPDQREMLLENDIVHYSYMDVEIHMIVDDRIHQIVTEGVDNIGLIIPFNYGDSGCLEVIFDRVDANREHFHTSASNMVETRERRSLQITNISSEICRKETVDTVVEYDVKLPAGTALSDVRVDYWLDNSWTAASCNFRPLEKKYICAALYQNPLFGDSYNIRTTIKEKEFLGSYISLENKCIIFEAPTN
jgi:hypothetical protein